MIENTVKKCAILCNGTIEDYEYCKSQLDKVSYIICADGGIEHAYVLNIIPDIIIGDLDSASDKCIKYFKQKKVKFIQLNKDKDKTDTQVCLEYSLEFSSEVIILGGIGSRLDHTIANISLLKLGLDRDIKVSLINEKNHIYMMNKHLEIWGRKGEILSLIPISEKVEGICVKGAYYELENSTMEIGQPYGVSNYFEKERVEIYVSKGFLLVIKALD